jgi:ribonuclease Z
MEKDADKAAARYHSTAKQAAQVAKMAEANKLLLGHYSSKYRDIEPFAEEAKEIFPNVYASMEGMTYDV